MSQLIVTLLSSLLRMVLLGWFATLIEKGVWTEGQLTSLATGLAGFIVVAGYALWNHYRNRVKLLTALEAPPGTTEAAIIATIKAGGGATL